MIRLLLFELAFGTYALKLEAVRRILAPAEPLPDGCARIDLAQILRVEAPAGAHQALLSGRMAALAIGRPLGTVRVEASWILPLPGYMFGPGEIPYRGIIEFPAGRRGRRAAGSRRGLLLDEEVVWRLGSVSPQAV